VLKRVLRTASSLGSRRNFFEKLPNSPSEFYVLEEREVTNHEFAEPGDSGE
jgi:hypothetical protein